MNGRQSNQRMHRTPRKRRGSKSSTSGAGSVILIVGWEPSSRGKPFVYEVDQTA
jgi:hypothetical protein